MSNEIASLFKTFENCRFDHKDVEAWRARDLMPLLGYGRWENFRDAIRRAWDSCSSSGADVAANFLLGDGASPWRPDEVFRDATKNPQGGRPSEDVILTRYAAYLVAMNGDTRKAEVAFAQQYFATATRALEVVEQRMQEAARLQAREKLSKTESKFQGVVFEHGVDGAGIARIRSKGDKVLFGGKDTQDMKDKWGVPANRPLVDFAPSVVVIGKEFATAITAHNVKTNKLRGEDAITDEHLTNNETVRSALVERGIVPEQLAAEEDIKKVERRHTTEAKKLAKPRPAPMPPKKKDRS